MFNLIKADLMRLSKNKLFYLILFMLCFCGWGFLYTASCPDCAATTSIDATETLLFIAAYNLFALILFGCLFIGTDYSFGTIRNKLISGQSRLKIYFSNLFLLILVGIIYFLSYVLVVLFFTKIFHATLLSWDKLIFMLNDILFLTIFYASIINLFSMLITDRTASLILNFILSFLAIGVSSSFLSNIMMKVEMGSLNQVAFDLAMIITPFNQLLGLINAEFLYYKWAFLYTIIFIIITNIVGIILFSKKDIK